MVAASFIAIVAVVVFFQRRPLAQLQAGIFGGSVVPGCVVAEAIALLAIAVAMFVFSR